MPRCPECGATITHLNYSISRREYGTVELSHTGNLAYMPYDSEYDGDDVYNCPECGEDISDDQCEINEFLSGKKDNEQKRNIQL